MIGKNKFIKYQKNKKSKCRQWYNDLNDTMIWMIQWKKWFEWYSDPYDTMIWMIHKNVFQVFKMFQMIQWFEW